MGSGVYGGRRSLREALWPRQDRRELRRVPRLLHDPQADAAVERSADAARDLPKANRLSRLLFEQSRKATVDFDALDDHVENYLTIKRVEPEKLWFKDYVGPTIGPVEVPKPASDLAQAGWSISIGLGRIGKTWHILSVGNVYP